MLSPAHPDLGQRVAEMLMGPLKGEEGDEDSFCPLHMPIRAGT